MQRVLLLYNTDYDAELIEASPADVSAVQEAARAVRDAIETAGYQAELVGIEGPDLDQAFTRLRDDPPDLVFNLCESLAGNTDNELLIPAMLDMLRIPYTGPGPVTIGICLDKELTKEVLFARQIATPPYVVIHDLEELANEKFQKRLADLDFPFFLKLSREDASIGIDETNLVTDTAALCKRARELTEKYRQPVIAERYIEGREVNVTVVEEGGGKLGTLPLHEIDFGKMPEGRPHIVSYAAKWDEDHVDYDGTKPVPMKNVSIELESAIVEVSKQTFTALGLRDFARVDLRIDSDNQPWVIDVNPNCDLSPDAGVARAAEYAGIDYSSFIGRICQNAWNRYASRNSQTDRR